MGTVYILNYLTSWGFPEHEGAFSSREKAETMRARLIAESGEVLQKKDYEIWEVPVQ